MGGDEDEKTCAVCGRVMTRRKAWERNWSEVRYCSDGCRRRRREVQDGGPGERLEKAVLALLDRRSGDATACPSEVARAEGGEEWRPLMEPVREAARRLHARGEVEWLQHGHVVDPSTAKGAVRLRRVRHH